MLVNKENKNSKNKKDKMLSHRARVYRSVSARRRRPRRRMHAVPKHTPKASEYKHTSNLDIQIFHKSRM